MGRTSVQGGGAGGGMAPNRALVKRLAPWSLAPIAYEPELAGYWDFDYLPIRPEGALPEFVGEAGKFTLVMNSSIRFVGCQTGWFPTRNRQRLVGPENN